MVDDYRSYRNSKRGIVLISTLISLMLLIGLTMAFQSTALANTKTIKRLEAGHNNDLRLDSMRELTRPHVALAALGEKVSGKVHRLNLFLEGQMYLITIYESAHKNRFQVEIHTSIAHLLR